MSVLAADDVEKATGWRPPIIYDGTLDQFRLVTQADIERFEILVATYAKICDQLRHIEHHRGEMRRLIHDGNHQVVKEGGA